MFNKETTNATGKVHVVLRDENQKIKEDFLVDNLVVDSGLAFIAERMKDANATVMSHMEIGTGGTAAAANETILVTAVAGSRTALDPTIVTANTITYVCTFLAGTGTGAIEEAGIFNDPSAGDMLCRTVFSVINKTALDSMTITWTITIS
jgi:hypothetical protein